MVRLSAWIAVVLVLIGSLLFALNRISEQANSASIQLIARSALDRANNLRQHWVLLDKPRYANIHGHRVSFNQKGWALPILEGDKECQAWQDILLTNTATPNQPLSSQLTQAPDHYQCDYTFSNGDSIRIQLRHGDLSIR